MKATAILLALPLALAFPAAGYSAEKTGRPNVLIILGDDIGYSDTSVMGGEIKTPNLEKLASEGRVFTQFYNTARCCPSRASLLTGQYPHEAGVGHMLWPTGYPGYNTHMTSDTVTIAEALHEAGYRTYMTGKWHLSTRNPDEKNPIAWPKQKGFDRFYGTLQGYGSYYDPATLCRDDKYITPENDPEYKPESFYYTDAIGDNAVKFIDEHDEKFADQPFMMYVAFTAAHWPLHVPDDSLAEYKGRYDKGYDAIRQERIGRMKQLGLLDNVGDIEPTVGDWDAVKNKPWEARRMEAFAATITRMDRNIGKILDHLREKGELDNTLVMFLQDNGGCDEEFFMDNKRAPDNVHPMGPNELQERTLPPMQTRDGRVVKTGEGVMAGPADTFIGYGPHWANVSDTPLRKVKKFTFEGGISTPMIIHWPAGMAKADDKWVTAPAHTIDIMPTVLAAAKAKYPETHNGVKIRPEEGTNLLPLVTGKGEFEREHPIFWEHEGNRAVRKGKWKLVADESKPWELYDIGTDRGEMHNVAEQHPDIVKELAAEWDAYAKRAKVQPLGAWRLREREPDPVGTPDEVTLDPGDVYFRKNAPALSNRGISITVELEKPGDGVMVAQGGSADGYAVYIKDGKVHFAVNRQRQNFEVVSPIAPDAKGEIKAEMQRDGHATLTVPGQAPVEGEFYSPLLLTPKEGLQCGLDQDSAVGKYEGLNMFHGDMKQVHIKTIAPSPEEVAEGEM